MCKKLPVSNFTWVEDLSILTLIKKLYKKL